jgi:SNF family Na+-dependent transporter
VRSGCLSLVMRVGLVSVAAVFAALSVALILSFAVSALGQPDGIERIFKVLMACAAGIAFIVVGRGIWRDLRERRPSPPESREDRGSAEDS